MKTIRIVAPLIVIFLHAGLAYGQRHEVSALFGGAKASSQEFRPADIASTGELVNSFSPAFQFNYGFRIAGGRVAALYAEVPITFIPSTDVEADNPLLFRAPRNYSSIFVTPGLKFKFAPEFFLSPYAVVGGGYARFEESRTSLDNLPNNGQRGTSTGAFDYGAGIDIRIVKHFGIRGEIRDVITGRPHFNATLRGTRQHNILPMAGIVFRF